MIYYEQFRTIEEKKIKRPHGQPNQIYRFTVNVSIDSFYPITNGEAIKAMKKYIKSLKRFKKNELMEGGR